MKTMIVIIIGCWIAVAVIGFKSLRRSYSVKIEKKTETGKGENFTPVYHPGELTLECVTTPDLSKTEPNSSYQLGYKNTEGANSTVIGYKEKHIKLGEY